jgi:hypothetical protein
MSRIAYIDTVSDTGVWEWKLPETSDMQPHMIRVAALLYDRNGQELDRLCELIREQPGWPVITHAGSGRHNIYDADLRDGGVDLPFALGRLRSFLGRADLVVMQNIQFHTRVMRRAWRDAELPMPDLPKTFCTMRGAAEAMASSKWVSLAQSFPHFVGTALMLPANPIDRGMAIVDAIRRVHLGIASRMPAATGDLQ